MSFSNTLLEKNLVPDQVIRKAIRRLNRRRLSELYIGNIQERQERFTEFVSTMLMSPLAVHTEEANEQHYEVPAAFFQTVLGKHLKYSCGYWPQGTSNLDDSEEAMLALTCARAQLEDGQHILELGCGWGSLTLYMASKYPNASITAVSNSSSQRAFILKQAEERGLDNVEVITCDMNAFQTDRSFDRVVSVEMFEHMRNHRALLKSIAGWLKPGGQLFVHIFVHRSYPYLFEVRDESDWMARYFFTGGMMPSDQLLLYYQEHLKIQEHWHVPGWHYQKTSEAWLERTTQKKENILAMFASVYGSEQALKWWVYWRVFFMACAELFGHQDGEEWFVSHYRFVKPENPS